MGPQLIRFGSDPNYAHNGDGYPAQHPRLQLRGEMLGQLGAPLFVDSWFLKKAACSSTGRQGWLCSGQSTTAGNEHAQASLRLLARAWFCVNQSHHYHPQRLHTQMKDPDRCVMDVRLSMDYFHTYNTRRRNAQEAIMKKHFRWFKNRSEKEAPNASCLGRAKARKKSPLKCAAGYERCSTEGLVSITPRTGVQGEVRFDAQQCCARALEDKGVWQPMQLHDSVVYCTHTYCTKIRSRTRSSKNEYGGEFHRTFLHHYRPPLPGTPAKGKPLFNAASRSAGGTSKRPIYPQQALTRRTLQSPLLPTRSASATRPRSHTVLLCSP